MWMPLKWTEKCGGKLIEITRKCVCEGGKLSKLTSKKQSKKNKKTKQNKAKIKRLAPSDIQTGQSQIRFQFLLSIWNFRHNNRFHFQISCFAWSIRGCSNAKGENWSQTDERQKVQPNVLHIGDSQLPTEKGQKDKQRSTKHYTENKWSSNMYMYIRVKTR
jgi:hypothetical protein